MLAAVRLALSSSGGAGGELQVMDLWLRLDEAAIQRVAHAPVALFTLNFQHLRWWEEVAAGRPAPAGTAARKKPFVLSTPLAQTFLTEAWLAARSVPLAVRLLYGMSTEMEQLISTLSAAQLTQVAIHHAAELQLRWSDRMVFWKGLLTAAIEGNGAELRESYLQSIWMTGGDFWEPSR
jgi:hypothetical protein